MYYTYTHTHTTSYISQELGIVFTTSNNNTLTTLISYYCCCCCTHSPTLLSLGMGISTTLLLRWEKEEKDPTTSV